MVEKNWAADYVDVPTRLAAFFDSYPNGTIQAQPAEIKTIGDKTFIAVIAAAYRTPDDDRPAIAQAWEPFPGKTPYTRDSEAMNAETSAVGRALGLMGFHAKKSIATAEEVRNRQAERDEPRGLLDFASLAGAIYGAKTLDELRDLWSKAGTDMDTEFEWDEVPTSLRRLLMARKEELEMKKVGKK